MTSKSPKKASIQVDAGQSAGAMMHNWNYIGYDECNYTYTPESEELLAKFQQFQEKPYYLRAHHILCTGNCHAFYKWGSTNAYLEDKDGNPIYNWEYVDLILDTILKYDCKPFVEIGFMPMDLVDPKYLENAKVEGWHRSYLQYQQYGWSCPPKDYQKWHDLVYNLVKHSLERYGADEIKTWYWELWNEPDIRYWAGTVEEFNKLYDYTAAAVKAAYPEARVGGPGVTNPEFGAGVPEHRTARQSGPFLDAFLDHCKNGVNYVTGEKGTVIDFTAFHVKGGGYPMDVKAKKGIPPSVKRILQGVKTGYDIIAKYPGYADLECVLTEIDPDGWAAGGMYDNINLEFRNTEYYPSFVAASFDKVSKFAKERNWDLRLLTWAYLFVGERCFEGTRAFSTQGIDKAILNLFRMYARMGMQEVSFRSSEAKDPLQYDDMIGAGVNTDISGFASAGEKSVEVLIYNHHDDWNLDEDWEVEVEVANLPFKGSSVRVENYRIDGSHSNAYPEWQRQGRPLYPSAEQKQAIKAREGLELVEPVQTLATQGGGVRLALSLPTHSVTLLVLTPVA